jgi:NAD+ diphosphatase
MPIVFPARESSRDPAYGGGTLDRLSERRGDPGFAEGLRGRDDARYLVFAADKPLLPEIGSDPRWPGAALARLGAATVEPVFLGVERRSGAPLFACQSVLGPDAAAGLGGVTTGDVRGLAAGGLLAPERLGEVAEAAAVLAWHRTHGFCPRCGQPSRVVQAGWQRNCPACGQQHFPRTDPVVIMLVVDGDNCLLGRAPRFAPGMFSALAGFVEPGETLEDAVRREVHEEAGIVVGRVGYFASQPWPFPMTLMVGMFGEATTRAIHMDDKELEACRWFSRAELRQMFAGTHPDGLQAPQPLAIAHHLLKTFAEG